MKIIGIIMRKESFEQCEKWFVNEAYITALQKLNAIIFPICDYASFLRTRNMSWTYCSRWL